MFFAGEVARENLIDLSGSGDIKNGVPEDLGFMLKNYISILEERRNCCKKPPCHPDTAIFFN